MAAKKLSLPELALEWADLMVTHLAEVATELKAAGQTKPARELAEISVVIAVATDQVMVHVMSGKRK